MATTLAFKDCADEFSAAKRRFLQAIFSFPSKSMPPLATGALELAGIAEGVGTKLSGTIDRIGQFFHIFDLSFFVSGSVTVAAFTYYYIGSGRPTGFPFPAWVGVIALLIACYVGGLFSFSIGRACNIFRRRKYDEILAPLLTELTLEEQLKYPPTGDLRRLYAHLWQELAFMHPDSPAFSHLSRYWVMAATYDGLSASLGIWGVALLLPASSGFISQLDYYHNLYVAPRVIAAAVVFVLAFMALETGAKYLEYQIYDLVAACVFGRRIKKIGA